MSAAEVAFNFVGHDKTGAAFKSVEGQAKSTGSFIAKLGIGVALAAGIEKMTSSVVDFAKESVGKFAAVGGEVKTLMRYTNQSAEATSQLRFEAEHFGVSSTVLARSIGLLSRNMATNSVGWRSMGIDAKDAEGHLKSMDQVLPEIEDHFAKMANGPEKTAEVLRVFGRAGMSLLPFLNAGAAGIAELAKQSDLLGNTLTSGDIASVTQYQFATREWDAALGGLQMTIGRNLLPILTIWIDKLTTLMPQIITFANTNIPILVDKIQNKLVPWLTTAWGWFLKHKNILFDIGPKAVGVALAYEAIAKTSDGLAAAAAAMGLLKGGTEGAAAAASKVTIVLAAIAAAGLIFKHFWDTSQRFRVDASQWIGAFAGAMLVALETFMDAIHAIWTVIIDGVFGLVRGLRLAMDNLPFIPQSWRDGMDKADAAVTGFRDSSNASFNDIHANINQWQRDMDNWPKEVVIQGNIDDLHTKITAAKKALADPKLTKPEKSKLSADLVGLNAQLAQAQAKLDSLNGHVNMTLYIPWISIDAAHGGLLLKPTGGGGTSVISPLPWNTHGPLANTGAGKYPAMGPGSATGNIFQARPGGWLTQVAEAGVNEAVIPLNGKGLQSIGGGNVYQIILPEGPYLGDRRQVVAWIRDAMAGAGVSGISVQGLGV
jgi:hypothetical protein